MQKLFQSLSRDGDAKMSASKPKISLVLKTNQQIVRWTDQPGRFLVASMQLKISSRNHFLPFSSMLIKITHSEVQSIG